MLATKADIDTFCMAWKADHIRRAIQIRWGPRLESMDSKLTNIYKMRKIDLVQLYLELKEVYG